ncbi:MAG: ABC transporter permease [Bacilli bacterium]|nr:ABC transporter permease [Bacilli bacterium]
MKAYISYFKLKFISSLQYRSAAWAGVATQFFFGFVYIMVYVAFYESGGKNLPMNLSQVVTYLWLNQALLALVNQFTRDPELFKLIREGGISYELARPKNIYFMWYFKVIGQRLANVTLRVVPLLVVTIILPFPFHLGAPESIYHFLFFLLSLGLGALLVTALTVFYPIVALRTLNEKGIVNIMITIADILSGIVVPIPFFPKPLQVISSFLPFQYISDLPFRLYVGNVSLTDGVFGMCIQIIWIIILIILGNCLMKKNIKRVVVQGG